MEKEVQKVQSELEAVRIKKIGVLSLANLSAIIHFFIGLILGIIVTIAASYVPLEGAVWDYVISLGKLAIVILPVFCGAFGWIFGIIVGVVYNLGAKIAKGIVLYA